MLGKLYGIGVGPGDPELITMKAYRRLMEVDVIAFPQKSKDSSSYAETIIAEFVKGGKQELLPLIFPMTKDQELLEKEWNRAVEVVSKKLQEGKDVAFVTEGDPLFYSTFIHLMKKMREVYSYIEIETIPAVSSIYGAASSLQLPLADGDDQLIIVPARNNYEAMKKVMIENDCIIFLKVAKVLPFIIDLLEELGLDKKAYLITKATAPDEKIWSIEEAKEKKVPYLSLLVVRK